MKSDFALLLSAVFLLSNVSFALQGRIAFARVPTRLNFKEEFVVVQHAQSAEQQEGVDAYLEFLHNRYSRMNEGIDQVLSNNGRNYSFRRVLQDENFENGSNAFEVLGLSNLASRKLLQKFQMNSGTPPIESEILSMFSKVMHTIVLSRKHFIALYETKLRALLSAFLNAMRTSPYTLNKIIALGGGRKSLLLSMSVASVFLFSVMRPLNHNLFKGALQQVTRA